MRLVPLVCLAVMTFIQESSSKPRTHEGFYASLALGPGLSVIHHISKDLVFVEPGLMADLKIGGFVAPNLALTFDLLGQGLTPAYLDATAGVGVTRYFASNYFLSGTLGGVMLRLKNPGSPWSGTWCNNYGCSSVGGSGGRYDTTPFGTSVHLKAGKEWWIADRWALGISAGSAAGMARSMRGNFLLYRGFLGFNITFD